MLIGVDATCWWNQRGFGRFTRGLLREMFNVARGHQFCLFIDQPAEPEMIHPDVRVVEVRTQRALTKSAVSGGRRSLRDVVKLSRAVVAERVDLMFFPAVYSWFPVGYKTPTVVTVHDAIAEHFPHLVFPRRIERLSWALKMRLACSRASRIVTVSHAAKQEMMHYIGIRPERIDVICEGVDAPFRPLAASEQRANARRRARIPLEGRLLLYVGGIAPHKNLSNLLAGFAEIALLEADLRLAIVGDPAGGGFHSNYQELVAQAEGDDRLSNRVHFTGFVPDEDLAALYSDALATVIPSFSEGFGLPALESLACGTPVLASKAGALAEVIGPAGLTFDPHSSAEIGLQIRRISSDTELLATLRHNALRRAGDFSWSKAAELTLTSLERCASRA
jgi:glycosyltransferase involved in cell wall biosynthesis